jgi:hypothetical protein
MIIVNKIKALLRLSQSPNPHEAELALTRAFEIAAKYHIDIEALDLGEEINRIIRESSRVGYRLSFSKRLAINIALNYFNVTPIISCPEVVWIGTQADIQMAKHVFYFLSEASDRLCSDVKTQYGARFTERRRKSFIAGFFYGISDGLNRAKATMAIAENQYGLILLRDEKKRERFKEQEFPNTVKYPMANPKRRDMNWVVQGYLKGKETEIHAPVNEHQACKSLETH